MNGHGLEGCPRTSRLFKSSSRSTSSQVGLSEVNMLITKIAQSCFSGTKLKLIIYPSRLWFHKKTLALNTMTWYPPPDYRTKCSCLKFYSYLPNSLMHKDYTSHHSLFGVLPVRLNLMPSVPQGGVLWDFML